MNERQAEPQVADVRPFLPHPGESADTYAARLRALHRDLTLVLDAVERGLAAAPPPDLEPHDEPEPAPASAFELEFEPALAGDPIGVPVAEPAPLDAERRREPTTGSLPRVEVVPRGREADEGWAGPPGRREGEPGAEAAAGAAAPPPEPPATARARRAGEGPPPRVTEDAFSDVVLEVGGEEVPLEPEPAADPVPPPRAPVSPLYAPEWQAPPRPSGLPPVVLAGLVAGWLAALALLLVVLLGL